MLIFRGTIARLKGGFAYRSTPALAWRLLFTLLEQALSGTSSLFIRASTPMAFVAGS